MENSKTIIGLLNSTLRGIRITTGESASRQSAELIAKGIYLSITKKSVADDFINYIKDNYSLKININLYSDY